MMLKELFGTFNGKDVYAYTLTNKNGMSIKVIEYGAILASVKVPSKNGEMEEMVLGYDTLADYQNDPYYFGATVGRYANRIANGKFKIDGKSYQLLINNAPNSLHGGFKGFDKVCWEVKNADENSIKLFYHSPDGDQGYPGNLDVTVTYELNDANEISVIFDAKTDQITPISVINHSYFNLAGAGNGDINDHQVTMIPDQYLELNPALTPTGKILDVKGTMFDLTSTNNSKNLGEIMKSDPNFAGFDTCFVISKYPQNPLKKVAKISEPKSSRKLEIHTTQAGIQFYTANFVEHIKIAGGKFTNKHGGFCMEAQNFPDGPNHPDFPNPFLKPDETYHQETVFKFFFEK